MTTNSNVAPLPSFGGKAGIVIFIAMLLSFVIESELTQYVQTTLQYRHPFFLFYIVHSSFVIIFPLHLLLLMSASSSSAASLLKGLSIAVANHLSPGSISPSVPRGQFLRLILALTAGVTYPALLWFAAISLASISDVTAIWNTNAFFAYVFSVKLLKLKWQPRRLAAVLLATIGTVAVVYGSTTSNSDEEATISISPRTTMIRPKAPLAGNLLTLIAAVGHGLYQVLYKIYAALPSDPEVTSEEHYQQLPENEDELGIVADGAIYPPPFGLHPNLLTSAIGLCTFALLWLPLPLLHLFDIEPFALPSGPKTILAIAGIIFSGAIFNASFMILLGLWGPIITSVGNLLTIVLVFFADVLFGAGAEAVTGWSLAGSGVIVAAFAVLAYDMAT